MAKQLGDLRVAIVHDWLIGGGAERVVLELHRMFPDAPIYTSYATEEWRHRLDNKVVTGYLQHWPFPALRKFVPFLRQWWFPRLKLQGFDLVISSSGAEAKGIHIPQGTVHINYCHAPTHYYWSRYEEYMQHPGFGVFDPLARLGLKLLVSPLRRWDYRAAQQPDYMIANSRHIQAEIKQYYGRDAVVINPPVDIARFEHTSSGSPRQGFLAGGRLTPYKRNDLAVEACTKLNIPLTVFGTGPDLARLKHLAGPSVTFTGRVSDEAVAQLFASSRAYIFPLLDDFGVVGIEAMAAGTPVIAYQAGGALDYVQPGRTGVFFKEQTAAALITALEEFQKESFDHTAIAQAAKQFSPSAFDRAFQSFIRNVMR